MTRGQRYQYEMLVRVRDFTQKDGDLFPAGAKSSQAFARVKAAVAAIEEHLKDHLLAQGTGRRVKSETRDKVYLYMKALATAGRRAGHTESNATPFRLPRHRSLPTELATARAFLDEAALREASLAEFGLPEAFLREFRALVDDLQAAVAIRVNSRTQRRRAVAGLRAAYTNGMEAVRDLDAHMAVASRNNPALASTWLAARRIEGMRSRRKKRAEEKGSAPATDRQASGG